MKSYQTQNNYSGSVRNPNLNSAYLLCLEAAELPPTTGGQHGATYGRGSGGRQQGQDASTGYDDVVHHLRDEVDGVVDKDDVLVAVHKVHH